MTANPDLPILFTPDLLLDRSSNRKDLLVGGFITFRDIVILIAGTSMK